MSQEQKEFPLVISSTIIGLGLGYLQTTEAVIHGKIISRFRPVDERVSL